MQQADSGFIDEPTESFDGRFAVITDTELDMLDPACGQCSAQVAARRGEDDRIPATISECRHQGQQRVFSAVERFEFAENADSAGRRVEHVRASRNR